MSHKFVEFSVQRYTADRKAAWDTFVEAAKNATFLFRRDYMDYHSDRFTDYSLMISCGNELIALLPANLAKDNTLVSHGGLTYGGLVVNRTATLCDVLACFHVCLRHLCEQQVSKLLYKRIPGFYNTLPDDDVAYVLFLLGARLYRRDCALVVNMADRVPLRKGRKSEISKARRFNVRAEHETSFVPFWERVLIPRLAARYGVKPVHSVQEITLLAQRFPNNIRQFSAFCGDDIVAGVTIYETETVAHAQYMAVSERGQEIGALDHLVGWLISDRYKDKRHFDFGICNEDEGRTLNYGMLDWKEAFGGRTYCHDFYEILGEDYVKLEEVIRGRLTGMCQRDDPT